MAVLYCVLKHFVIWILKVLYNTIILIGVVLKTCFIYTVYQPQ